MAMHSEQRPRDPARSDPAALAPAKGGRTTGQAAGTAQRAPASTGGYLRTRKTASNREVYADFIRRLHDPGTEYYGLVRGIITRSHTGIVGEFPSTKVGGLPLPYESQNERKAFLIRETDPNVKIFHAQPLRLWLESDKAPRRYTADILTVYWDDRIVLEEVKPKNKLDHPAVMERHRLARDAAEAGGWEFAEVTDVELGRQPRLANAELLVRYARLPLEASLVGRAAAAVSGGGAVTLGQLERELKPWSIRFVDLLGMVARGAFDAELELAPLSASTPVRKARYPRRYFR